MKKFTGKMVDAAAEAALWSFCVLPVVIVSIMAYVFVFGG